MARRGVTTDRLIAVLGGVVLTLGVLLVWNLTRPGGGFVEEAPAERVLRQAKEILGPRAQVLLVQLGRGRVVCGYVAPNRQVAGQPFVSRPNRMMLMSDPFSSEFRDVMARECPDMPHGPVAPKPAP